MTTKADTRLHTARRSVALLALLPIALGLAACGDDDDSTATGSDSGSGSGSGAISITSPADGAEVGSSFDVKVDSTEDLGAPDSGKMHFHVYFDGDKSDYDISNGDSVTVDRNLSEGEHTLEVALANADHSLTGDEDEITVMVGAGAGSGGNGSETTTTDDGY